MTYFSVWRKRHSPFSIEDNDICHNLLVEVDRKIYVILYRETNAMHLLAYQAH